MDIKDLDTINAEMDDYFNKELPKILEGNFIFFIKTQQFTIEKISAKIEEPVILISQAKKLCDDFRVHLQNQKKPEDSDSIMLDHKTLNQLRDFNEGVVKLLNSFKECEDKKAQDQESSKNFKSLDEFVSSIVHALESNTDLCFSLHFPEKSCDPAEGTPEL
jgi:hypothetical protein